MAQNVKFIKGDTATLAGVAIVDGQLLYNTTTGQHYIDNESSRVEVGKPVVNTTAEVSAITVDNIPCGTKPVKELTQNLINKKLNASSVISIDYTLRTYTVPAFGEFVCGGYGNGSISIFVDGVLTAGIHTYDSGYAEYKNIVVGKGNVVTITIKGSAAIPTDGLSFIPFTA